MLNEFVKDEGAFERVKPTTESPPELRKKKGVFRVLKTMLRKKKRGGEKSVLLL